MTTTSSTRLKACLLLAFACQLSSLPHRAFAATVVTKDPVEPILADGFGYNTRFPDTQNPWGATISSIPGFWTVAFDATLGNCIRYPGGTVGSFWNGNKDKLLHKKLSTHPDADDGWIDTAKVGFDFITDIILPENQKVNSLSDLKTVTQTTGASVLFVLNLATPGRDFYAEKWNRTINDHPGVAYNAGNPDDWYKMLDARYNKSKQMLIKAQNQQIPIKYIELGNEYYLANSTYYKEAFPDNVTVGGAQHDGGWVYAVAANYIANKLRNDTALGSWRSTVKISVPAAAEKIDFASSRILAWNAQLTSKLSSTNIKYITLHSYQEAQTGITVFTNANVKSNAGNWFVNMNTTLADKQADTKILAASTPWQVWWNELSATQAAGMEGKWGSLLLDVWAALWAANHKGALFMHPNLDATRVINPTTGELNAMGWALVPVMNAANGCTKSAHLNFPGLPQMSPSTRAVLQGQYFETADGSKKNCCIVSFYENAVTLDLTNIYGNSGTITISGQQNTDLNSSAVPTHTGNSTAPKSAVVIPPYSVNFIRL